MDGRTVPVAAVLGPEVDAPGAAVRARNRAGAWVGRRDAGVLPLIDVAGAGDRVAWVYEACDGVSAGVLFDSAEAPVPRAAVELVAACAEVLERLHAAGHRHPGPAPDDVIVDPRGEVVLAGFVGPFPQAPMQRDPQASQAPESAAVVWRLGVLLAELLSGSPPPPPMDHASHEVALQRLMVRVVSQPGPILPERLGDWLRGMLAWTPTTAPSSAGSRPACASWPRCRRRRAWWSWRRGCRRSACGRRRCCRSPC
ncbi:MAG: hypothetical protein R3F59_01760 [Myxococcota bacterium]